MDKVLLPCRHDAVVREQLDGILLRQSSQRLQIGVPFELAPNLHCSLKVAAT